MPFADPRSTLLDEMARRRAEAETLRAQMQQASAQGVGALQDFGAGQERAAESALKQKQQAVENERATAAAAATALQQKAAQQQATAELALRQKQAGTAEEATRAQTALRQTEGAREAQSFARAQHAQKVAGALARGIDVADIVETYVTEDFGPDEVAGMVEEAKRATRKAAPGIGAAKRAVDLERAQVELGEAKRKAADPDRAVRERKQAQVIEVENFAANIKDNIESLKQQIASTGTFEMFGPESMDMERRIGAIAIDMAKLADPESVARPSEVEEMKRGLFPTGVKALGTRNATALQVLDHLLADVERRRQKAYRVRGLADVGQQQAGAATVAIPDDDRW